MKKDALKRFLDKSKPFGPIDANDVSLAQAPEVSELFNQHNRLFDSLRNNPSIIIGRRGAGKTAYLRSIALKEDYKVRIELNTAELLAGVAANISAVSGSVLFVERIADTWQALFWLALFHHITLTNSADFDDVATIKAFVECKDVMCAKTTDGFLVNLLNDSRNLQGGDLLELLRPDTGPPSHISFEKAQSAAMKFLQRVQKKAVLLLDSIEDYKQDISSAEQAVKGLLKCVGRFNEMQERLHLRFCLPAEVYPLFLESASNPLKDFRSTVALQWKSNELWQIAAYRYQLFLQLYHPSLGLAVSSLETRGEVYQFIDEILPKKITNAFGRQELTTTYILRHTQIMPRHILLYLNEIFEVHGRKQGVMASKPEPAAVRAGVEAKEEVLADEILSAYRSRYHSAKAICDACLPELPLRFPAGELHSVFNHRAKRIFNGEFADFQRMLLDIGVIGKVVSEDADYVQGVFQFTLPNALRVGSKDELCMHPVFCRAYGAKWDHGRDPKPVYPIGVHPEDPDVPPI